MARIDTADLLSRYTALEVVGRYISLDKFGSHYKGICPFHDDADASLIVTPSNNLIKCFSCGWSEDVIGFVNNLKYSGDDFLKACQEIVDPNNTNLGSNSVHRQANKPKQRPQIWTQIVAPEVLPDSFNHYKHGVPSKVWTYTLADGNVTGYVCRFDLQDGTKEVLPYSYCTDGAKYEWRWKGFDRPRPMYNSHMIAKHPNATVLIVEGEKTADAAQVNLDPEKVVVTTWPGGSMAIDHIDWSPIHGRAVVLWPDNDVQGLSAMLHIRHKNGDKILRSKIVPLDTTMPKGWDCADRSWILDELRDFVVSRYVTDIPANAGENTWRMAQVDRASVYEFGVKGDRWVFSEIKRDQPEPPQEPENTSEVVESEYYGQITISPDIPEHPEFEGQEVSYSMGNENFKFLGFDKGEQGPVFHFFINKARIVLSLSPSQLTKPNLLTMAPLQWWEGQYPGQRGGIELNMAQNYLINNSISAGFFREKMIRGRGAWVDEKRVIIHTGGDLIVNGIRYDLGQIDSKYVYERGDDLDITTEDPLKKEEANILMKVVELLNWEREIDAYLITGWVVVAAFCGALKWRPHIWLTGAAGTGKSWVFYNIVRRLLGPAAIDAQGETSEAGLRQMLCHDAIPVVFDEAEGEDRRAQDRMQSVLGLMRAASADDGGLMIKGTAGGTAKTFRIRSCFAFASIAVQVAQQSDRTRVTVLGLKELKDKDVRDDRWTRLLAIYNEHITDDFVNRLQARTVNMLPTILKNAETFSNAAAAELGQQRTGDQLGAMLAGAYSLHSDNVISFEDARRWIQSKDWSEERGHDKTKDEILLLAHIMEQTTKVESLDKTFERSIGELVMTAAEIKKDETFSYEAANDRLKRLGMKVEENYIIISNTADYMRKTLVGTPWAKNHNKILMRIDRAEAVESTRFGSGVRSRGVRIPIDVLEH